MNRSIWVPPGPARAADPRVFRGQVSRIETYGFLANLHATELLAGTAIVAPQAINAGRPAPETRPVTVSAAGWVVVDPLRLLPHAGDNQAWWTYLETLASLSVELDLPRVAARWVADTLAAEGLGRAWRDVTDQSRLDSLTRLASAAMVLVADGELHRHQLGPAFNQDLEHRGRWAEMCRPETGQLGWKAAVQAVQNGRFEVHELEPWGPMLDVSGVMSSAALEAAPAAIARVLRRITRAVQGQARAGGIEKQAPRMRRGATPAPPLPAELHVDWVFEHPEVGAIWQRAGELRRNRTVSVLAYQLGRAARDAAMKSVSERVNAGRGEPAPPSGLARAMGDLSVALEPVLAGVRGDKNNEINERRVDAVLLAWSEVGQDIPHLRPALSGLQLELDPLRCLRMRVSGVALSPETKTVYVNLGAGWDRDELCYAFAELALHLLLGHPARTGDKEPGLWNLACDLLLAGWLREMGYGTPPPGAPYDETLSKLPSAEAIYLRLLDLPGAARRPASLRGGGLPDMMEGGEDAARALSEDEDRLWREAARRGMDDAQALMWAGSMPAGLLRELGERSAEPVPWRPALQAYLGSVVPTRVRRRSYARPSRRASLNPMEPRPARDREEPGPRHSLVVVIDTSGSVSDRDLAEALGGIRTTCQVLGIERVRVLSCDAGVTDHGWTAPWRAGDRVQLTGGGGTSLVPALQLTDQLAEERDGVHPETPMLIFTDGLFEDRLAPGREHAYLMPPGCRLLFPTSAPVFTVRAQP